MLVPRSQHSSATVVVCMNFNSQEGGRETRTGQSRCRARFTSILTVPSLYSWQRAAALLPWFVRGRPGNGREQFEHPANCAGCPNYFQQGGLVLSGDTAGGAKPWLNLDANGAITNRTKLGPAPGSFAALEPAEEFPLYRLVASDQILKGLVSRGKVAYDLGQRLGQITSFLQPVGERRKVVIARGGAVLREPILQAIDLALALQYGRCFGKVTGRERYPRWVSIFSSTAAIRTRARVSCGSRKPAP